MLFVSVCVVETIEMGEKKSLVDHTNLILNLFHSVTDRERALVFC